MSYYTATFLRDADTHTDGLLGSVYRVSWATGHMDMVFSDDAHKRRWLRSANDAAACDAMASDSYHPTPISADL